MKILALDTSSIVATCAILDDNKLIGEYIVNNKRTHSKKIMPMIKEILISCELDVEDIDVFAAAKGPGSFTGLRIGLATIKSLAHVTNKPVIGISTIDALAFNLPYSEGIVVPMMDARRDRVYTGIYKWEDGDFYVIEKHTVLEVSKLLEKLTDRNERVVFNGDGSIVYREKILEALKERSLFAPRFANMARASTVGELAFIKAKKGEIENCFELKPDYIRESQAERQYREKINLCGVDNE